MYIELEDVLWAIVVTGFPTGTVQSEQKTKKNVLLIEIRRFVLNKIQIYEWNDA